LNVLIAHPASSFNIISDLEVPHDR